MSEENVEIVRRIYGEVPARVEGEFRELWDPDFEMDLTDITPDVEIVRGLDAAVAAIRVYFEDLRLPCRASRADPRRRRVLGHRGAPRRANTG
jgi:ketosteroid isomerase-like protein